jgi:hypothetical protein
MLGEKRADLKSAKRTADTEPGAVATGCYHSIHPTAGLLSITLSQVELSIPSLSLGVLYHSAFRFTDWRLFWLASPSTEEAVSKL